MARKPLTLADVLDHLDARLAALTYLVAVQAVDYAENRLILQDDSGAQFHVTVTAAE